MRRRNFIKTSGAAMAALAFKRSPLAEEVSALPEGAGGPMEVPSLHVWYRQPAVAARAASKVGSGRLGAMVFGVPDAERVALNHTWLWRKWKLGGLKNPVVAQNLPGIRQLFFDGKLAEANAAANRLLGSHERCKPNDPRYRDFGPDPFQPVGDLNITLPGHTDVSGYRRSLDLATNVVHVSYEFGGIRFTREVFSSYADDLILIRLTANKFGALSGVIDLFRVPDKECSLKPWSDGHRIGFEGRFLEDLKFAVTAQVWSTGGKGLARVNPSKAVALWSEEWQGSGRGPLRVGRPEFVIEGADEVLIAVAVATDHETTDPRKLTENQLDRVHDLSDYESLLDRHFTAYGKLFDSMSVQIDGPDRSHLPHDERLAAFRNGAEDPQLVAMQVQFGRAELLGCSRAGGAPAGLTGIWCELLRGGWNADIHHDDGFNDKYFLTHVTNLSECAAPVFDYLDRCIEPGREAARNLYGCRGVFIPLTNDAWARCFKVEPGWDEWTGAAAWLAQHYWWQYEFHGDREFLRQRLYPFLKEVALFYEDYLVEDPRPDSRFHGKLVTVPSQSPENTFVESGVSVPTPSLCIAATMDLELIHDVLSHCIEASEILQLDADKRTVWTGSHLSRSASTVSCRSGLRTTKKPSLDTGMCLTCGASTPATRSRSKKRRSWRKRAPSAWSAASPTWDPMSFMAEPSRHTQCRCLPDCRTRTVL